VLPVPLGSANYGTNPITTDTLGNLVFWAAPGVYDLLFTIQGVQTTRTVVVRADPAESGLVVPVFRAMQNAVQEIASGIDSVTVLLQDVVEDTVAAYNASSGVWTCKVAGVYQLFGQVAFGNGTTGGALTFARLTSTSTFFHAQSSRILESAEQQGTAYFQVGLTDRFTIGQNAQLEVYQSTGSNQPTSGDYQTFMSIAKVSD
jgi:hypothetical protein